MRVCVDPSPDLLPDFMRRFRDIAASFSIQFDFAVEQHRSRMLVMVSREGHCLHHILSRRMLGDLSFDVSLVVSNHENLRASVEAHGIPFVNVPVTPESRIAAEARLRALIQRHAIEWLALSALYCEDGCAVAVDAQRPAAVGCGVPADAAVAGGRAQGRAERRDHRQPDTVVDTRKRRACRL